MTRARHIALVDHGSTSTKAAIGASGRGLEAVRSVDTPTRLHGGRVEVDAVAVADAVERLLADLAGGDSFAAVGLICQRSTCLLWDRETLRPLAPALSWMDTSAAGRCDRLAGHAEAIARVTGLRLSPHYAASKLSALLDEVPGARRRAETGEVVAGTLDAFLCHRLTGRPTTEPGHAGRTLLYDLDGGTWDERLCALFGVPTAALPTLEPSVGKRGETAFGPLVALAGDQQAALVGHGGWRSGIAAAHFGTGAFVLASTGTERRRDPGLLTAVLASTPAGRRFQIEGSVNAAGAAVDWACRLTGVDIEDWRDRPLDPEALPCVVPAFTGAAAPWWRPEAKATITGLGLDTDGETLVAAVLAGVAQRVVDCVEALDEAGQTVETLRVSGRLTRLDALVGLLADLSGRPVEVAADEETGLLGLSRLTLAGADDDEAPLNFEPPVRTRREPVWDEGRRTAVRAAWREEVARALGPDGRRAPGPSQGGA